MSPPDATSQLDELLAAYEPPIEALMHHSLDALDQTLPGATRLVYDNWNATVVGYTPDGHARHAVCSVAAYPRWVNLFFFVGDALADPRLKGTGSTVRHIRLTKPDDLDSVALRLVEQAQQLSGWAIDPAEAVTTRVVSISDKRRPRRPR